jgi:aryl-phospho-beta-D-glucosidase BglC (GH1 family)
LRSSQIRGINITGGEISIGGYGEGVIGFLNKSYLYHDKSKIWKSLSQKGIKHVRFPVRLERLFRTNGDIKRNDMHALETAIELAKDNGIKISIDIHNYANMRIHNNVEKLSKDSAFSIEFYKKTLRRFARLADDHDNIESISIMNEPVGVSKPQWEYISQIAVDTLREANYNKMIYVSTWFWGGIQDATHHSKPWIIDSGPHAYEVHQYFDHGHSGFYRNSYQHDEIAITKDGYAPGDCTLY